MYYYGARFYADWLARFVSVDPHAMKYPGWSPYNYVFNNPINMIDPDGRDGIYVTFPDYKANGYPFTGHAGVLLIDNKTGLSKYYEYGRYDKAEIGIVRHYAIPDAVIGADGRPTAESVNKIMQAISKESGKGQRIEGAYFESDKFKEMNDYAQGKLKENTDPNREPYTITDNNCGTFADDVVKQDEDVNAPLIIDPRPVSIVGEYQENLTPVHYKPNEGTSIEYNNETVKYDNSTGKTSSSQSWWQRTFYSKDE